MEDEKIAYILADEFNKLSRVEEVNREDEEWLCRLQDKKRYLCEIMDLLSVNGLIDFKHKVRAYVKEGTCAQEFSTGQSRVEKIANYLVDYYNENREVLLRGVFTGDERKKQQAICSVTEKYLSALGLGVINSQGTAIVRIERQEPDVQEED